MKDIYGTVGYMIDVMDNRKCVRDYIRASTESDSTTATSGGTGIQRFTVPY
jgi:hypothetical protein